jgi:uncharacterized protein (DUF1778 family)
MEIVIKAKRRKGKLIGIRLYPEEYDLISAIAKEKEVSRSFVTESLIRAAMETLKKESKHSSSGRSATSKKTTHGH